MSIFFKQDSINENKNITPKKSNVYYNLDDIDGILNSKFYPLYLQYLEELIDNKLQDKIYVNLEDNKNNSTNKIDETFKFVLINKNGLIPEIACRYIQAKSKLKFNQILKEAKKSDKNIHDLFSYYSKLCNKSRNKISDQKKVLLGIDLERNEYFYVRRPIQFRFVKNISKKIKQDIAENNNSHHRISIRKLFNFNLNPQDDLITTSDEERKECIIFILNYLLVKVNEEIEKVKLRIEEEKIIIEKEKKMNKKYLYVKSRFLDKDSREHSKDKTARRSIDINNKVCLTQITHNDKSCILSTDYNISLSKSPRNKSIIDNNTIKKKLFKFKHRDLESEIINENYQNKNQGSNIILERLNKNKYYKNDKREGKLKITYNDKIKSFNNSPRPSMQLLSLPEINENKKPKNINFNLNINKSHNKISSFFENTDFFFTNYK